MSNDLPEPSTPGSVLDLKSLSASAYEDLRRLARARLRSSGPLTLLDTSGLVSDTYRRLVMQEHFQNYSRAQFLGYCSRIMRSVIIDLVRERNADRRGGNLQRVTLNTSIREAFSGDDEPLQIDEALAELAAQEPRLAQVVEMRYYGGYSETEVAEALSVTSRTVQRDWQKARVLLKAMLLDTE